jgi:multidrug resistance efflux pump
VAALALMAAGYRRQDIAAAEAAVESARAAVAAIDRQIEELKVVSPVAGTVESIELEPGDLVAANAPALSVLDASRLWVRAYVPENRLSLRVGQRVPVRVDAFPGRRFMGRITFIARDAEFTPGNVQTPEERSKQVFRIKVTIEQGLNVLRPGMAADVLLDEARPANEPGLGSEAKPGGEAGPESEAEPENEPGLAGAAA